MDCGYYSEDDITATDKHFSMIHFNSRSLYRNFTKIKDYSHQFKFKFSVVAVSETWLGNDKKDIDLEGYDLFHENRVNSRGGRVALFVKKGLKWEIIQEMTITVDALMECVTVEIRNEQAKNTLISCIYTTPGSCIDEFNRII